MTEVAPGVYLPGVAPEHEHRGSDRCNASCPHYPSGYRVWPARWAQDAAVIAAEIDDIRRQLSNLRGRIDNLRTAADGDKPFDDARSLAESKGCVQGAIVMLYRDLQRWEKAAAGRAAIDERLPPVGPPERRGCCGWPTDRTDREHSPVCHHHDWG